MFGLLNFGRLLNEQLEKVSKESTSLRVQNARLASQVCYFESLIIATVCSFTTTTTTILWLSGFCPGQPTWACTRRNIHPLTPIVVSVIPYLLPPSYDPWQFMCLTVFLHNLCPSFLWSMSWPCTLQFAVVVWDKSAIYIQTDSITIFWLHLHLQIETFVVDSISCS